MKRFTIIILFFLVTITTALASGIFQGQNMDKDFRFENYKTAESLQTELSRRFPEGVNATLFIHFLESQKDYSYDKKPVLNQLKDDSFIYRYTSKKFPYITQEEWVIVAYFNSNNQIIKIEVKKYITGL